MVVERPLVTIGMICYREGDWLRECWESVLRQTDNRWTAVLIMDGGGDAETRRVFDELSHPRLRKYALSRNAGPFVARNKAFEMTDTPFHFELDGDDQLCDDMVATVLQTSERSPSADFIFGDLELFGTRQGVMRYPVRFTAADLASDIHPPGACAYRKSLWSRLGGYAVELAHGMADYDFFIGAYEVGASGVHCGKTIYRYRSSSAARVSESYLCRYPEKCKIIVKRHPAFFENSALRRRFMAMGYDTSAKACLQRGLSAEARWNAVQAILQSTGFIHRISGRWRYFVPHAAMPLADKLVKRAKAIRSVQRTVGNDTQD